MTYGQLVPTMIEILLEKGALGDTRPRIQQYGATPIHPETLKAILKVRVLSAGFTIKMP